MNANFTKGFEKTAKDKSKGPPAVVKILKKARGYAHVFPKIEFKKAYTEGLKRGKNIRLPKASDIGDILLPIYGKRF